jgi:uncharacterized protein
LPKRDAREKDVSKRPLKKPGKLEELDTTLLVPAEREWEVIRNLANNRVSQRIKNNDPLYVLHHTNTELRKDALEEYSYNNNRYDTVKGEVTAVREFRRKHWNAKTITNTILTSTRTHFIIRATLDAYLGDVRYFSKSWDEKIKRMFV